jgi:hypothetical protein
VEHCIVEKPFERAKRILLLYLDYLAGDAKFNMETRLYAVPRDFVIEVMKP